MVDVWLRTVPPLAMAAVSRHVRFHGLPVEIPFGPKIRMSLLAGNVRVQSVIDACVRPGDLAVDVGAHIGLNALYSALRAGPAGRVMAVEPAPDTVAVLRRNLTASRLPNITVCSIAAGSVPGTREFFVRGDVSAVSSFFADSFYAPVTSIVSVQVAPLDDLVDAVPRLVKIDVEGAELDVIGGMTRILQEKDTHLLVEWHPVLQESAGYAPDALPRALWERGFAVDAVSHRGVSPLRPHEVADFTARLRLSHRPVDLWARRE